MKMHIYALLLALSIINTIESQCRCGRRSQLTRIVNGTEAPDGAYPWLVSVQSITIYKDRSTRNNHCGGSIINSEWILTAAHCFIRNDSDHNEEDIIGRHTYVIVGTNDNSLTRRELFHVHRNLNVQHNPLPKGVHKVAQVITHKSYERKHFKNDIALLRVEKPFAFGPKIASVCLTNTSDNFYTSLHVAGWGRFATDVKGSPQMHHVEVQEVYKCRRYWSWVDQAAHLCYRDGYKGTCKGDSGGPLVVSKNDVFFQVGLVSWGGKKCEVPFVPSGATRVSYHRDWIHSNVKTGTWCKV